jgi:hypothetical protein
LKENTKLKEKILKDTYIYSLKHDYNHYLTRYYNGIKYCEEHIEEVDIWVNELNKISYMLGRLIEEINKYKTMTEDEILKGFKE